MQDNWTVDRDILHKRISALIAKKERFVNSEFNDSFVAAVFCKEIYETAKELVALHEKFDRGEIKSKYD